jgi:hypothetical protein
VLAPTVAPLARDGNGRAPSIHDDGEALALWFTNADGGEVHTVALFVDSRNVFVKTSSSLSVVVVVVVVVFWQGEAVPPLPRGMRSRHGTTMHGERQVVRRLNGCDNGEKKEA